MSNQVAKVANTDEAQLPAYLQDGQYTNNDNFDQSDVVIPQIKLLQGLSPEVEEYDNAKSGEFWHTALDMSLGDNFRFVIADRRKKILLAAPLADGQGVLARADDAKTWDTKGEWQVKIKNVKKPVTWKIDNLDVAESGLMEWGSSNPEDEDSPPAATLFYDYLIWPIDNPELGMCVLSLARSKIKKAKKGLNDKIAMNAQNGKPMQALIFGVKSVDDQSDDGPYKNVSFRSAGFVQDVETFKMLREHEGALAKLRIQDEASAGEEPAPAPADSDKF